MPLSADQARLHRMKLLKALHFDCKGLISPSVKWADTFEELEQSFSLVHDEYLKMGYIKTPNPSGMHYGLHNLLPETVTLIVKSDSKIVATLTQVPDTREFGLPMDQLYQNELNWLRKKGRRIAELCSLVTMKQLRWKNLYMQMSRIMYNHSICNGIDDFCIMVNPRHVAFYKMIFLFEELGPEKHYPALGVPAVALRLDLKRVKTHYKEKFGSMECDCNLYEFIHQPDKSQVYHSPLLETLYPPNGMPEGAMAYFGLGSHHANYAVA